ncbi:MAG: ATP-dependent DNA helicase RecG, partial [Clostridia bacterium]|nr:ATP-dependent DNA helicase RecG [Clostridia bacterium]
AYLVCPAVEEGETEIAAAVTQAKALSEQVFSAYRVGLLHGKMKPKEKQKIMADFAAGDIQLLVATTVIEVGVDVPNATLMVVENAERFGLSQLHQLRGRVGRGRAKSYCVLLSDAGGDSAKQRLEALCKTNDGFAVADADLRLRGPGDFFGARQHGLPQLHIADLLQDMDTLREAKEASQRVIADDPLLQKEQNGDLKDAIARLFRQTGAASLN